MAKSQHFRKVGAHSNQETRPGDSSSSKPTVAPDSQPRPTGRKRKYRTLLSQQRETQKSLHEIRTKRHRTPDPHSDRIGRLYWDSLSRLWLASDALRELDQRNALLAAEGPQEVCQLEHQIPSRDLEHFARHGGPDLSDIRQVWKSYQISQPLTCN